MKKTIPKLLTLVCLLAALMGDSSRRNHLRHHLGRQKLSLL